VNGAGSDAGRSTGRGAHVAIVTRAAVESKTTALTVTAERRTHGAATAAHTTSFRTHLVLQTWTTDADDASVSTLGLASSLETCGS
jgi:hypothetical protein